MPRGHLGQAGRLNTYGPRDTIVVVLGLILLTVFGIRKARKWYEKKTG